MKTKQGQKTIFFFLVVAMVLMSLLTRVWQIDKPNQYLFDEDLHAFTALLISQNDVKAYEWWHQPFANQQNQYTYRPPAIEWIHPPLAKEFQALSIKLLGNRPLGWRLPSALAGAGITLLAIYLTLSLSKNYWVSLTAGLLISLEQLTYVQSRIASADIFLSLLVLLTAWLYWRAREKITGPRLLLAGLSFGLLIASKWSGFFLFPGLMIFGWFYRSNIHEKPKFWTKLSRNFLLNFAVLSVGVAIYVLSYSQAFLLGKNAQDILDLHSQAWWYQTQATFTHPYQSRPQDWLIGQKPVWYYYNITDKGEEKIVAQPTVWLLILGELSLILSATNLIKTKKTPHKNISSFNQNLLLISAISSLWLPWFFISRTLFIYQLTPIMPLLIISLSLFLLQLATKLKLIKSS